MNLIFIYGPPAAGKLTVARELAKLTGYKLFHNHLTFDLVHSVFENKDSNGLVDHLRLEVFKQAALSDISGIVFTLVYGFGVDDRFVKSVIDIVETSGGQISFVQLLCDPHELRSRVGQESRQQFKKVKDPTELNKLITEYDFLTPIPFAKSLTINNTNLDPLSVAKKIQTFYKL